MSLVLLFKQGKKGDYVARMPNGKIALINRNAKNRPRSREKWLCRVDFEKERFTVVTPIEKVTTKEIPVFDEYKCGHRVFDKIKKEEMPESQKPEPEIRKITWEVCPECKKSCEHKELEWTGSDFIASISCKDCSKTIYSKEYDWDKDEEEVIAEILEEIEQRFPQFVEEAERNLREWAEWKKEYCWRWDRVSEISREVEKYEEEFKKIIRKYTDFEYEDYGIDNDTIVLEKTEYYKEAPEEPYSVARVTKRIKLSKEDLERLREVFERLAELVHEEDVHKRWLIRYRPRE